MEVMLEEEKKDVDGSLHRSPPNEPSLECLAGISCYHPAPNFPTTELKLKDP